MEPLCFQFLLKRELPRIESDKTHFEITKHQNALAVNCLFYSGCQTLICTVSLLEFCKLVLSLFYFLIYYLSAYLFIVLFHLYFVVFYFSSALCFVITKLRLLVMCRRILFANFLLLGEKIRNLKYI